MKKQLLIVALAATSLTYMSCASDTSAPETETSTSVIPEAAPQQTTPEPTNPTADMPKTDVEVVAPMHDFGKVKEGGKLKHSFKIKNVGDQPFLIADAKPSCGCTVPSFSKKPILPGEEASIDIEFDTNGRKGNNTKDVTVTSNAKQDIKLSFKAEVE